jgi:hypothetical protein
MTQLTRRRDKDNSREGWLVYFGDVRVGHISQRAGAPPQAPQWQWRCGFYPGCDPGQSTTGTGDTFEEARADFEMAWQQLAATRTEEHYELWRSCRDSTAWKYRMHDEGLPLPTQRSDGTARCFCGEAITIKTMDEHIRAAHRGVVE